MNRRDSEVSYPPTNSDGGDGGNYNDQRQLIEGSPKKVQFNSQIEEIPLEEFAEVRFHEK